MVSQSNYNAGRLFFLVCLLLCLSGLVSAQIRSIPTDITADSGLGGSNTIAGNVTLPSGQRLGRRVRVRLFTATKGDVTSTTDDDGRFTFRGLVGGDYTIAVDDEKEFEPASQDVRIIQFRGSPPQTYSVQIRLTYKGNTAPKAGVVNAELANVPQPALKHFNKALELAKTGDHKGAIEQLQLAISEYPKFMLAFNELGLCYLQLNDLEKADASFQASLKIEPEAFPPLLNRGMVLVLLKRYAEAEPVLRKLLKQKENSAAGHYFLGQALANLGSFEEAIKELTSGVNLGGEEMKEAHRLLAILYNARGDKKQAVNELETYLRLVPATPDAEQLRQVIRQLKGPETPTPPTQVKPSP